MNNYKICVYAICKNEEQFVERWVDSMSEADVIVVLDTGSVDNTVARLKKRGVIVYTEEIKPWRFDKARNLSLDKVPADVDICVCTDLDEVFELGWRAKLESAWKNHKKINEGPIAKSGRYLYNWSLKEDNTPDVQFTYFKIHDRNGFYWSCPVHEYVSYKGSLPVENVFIDGLVLNHYPDAKKSRGSYLQLLELAVEEDPSNDRMMYYLGREYMYVQNWHKCIEVMQKYLLLPSATWNEERCAAMRWMAKSFFKLENYEDSFRWYYRAIAEASYFRDPYIEFAQTCYHLKKWELVYFLTKHALNIAEKSTTYVNMGYSWDHTPDDLCSIAAYNLGLFDEAMLHAKKALSSDKNNTRLKNNLEIITEKLTNSKQ